MMNDRKATIEWRSGQVAILDLDGWTVIPRDDVLAALLNSKYSLAATQARRSTTVPDLLACAARAAAGATGAEIVRVDPPLAVENLVMLHGVN